MLCAGQVIKVPVGENDDGDEDIVMWTHVFEDVVREMLRDPRLDGHMAWRFQIHEDADGRRIFGAPNGCLSFQIHAHAVGPNSAPVSLVGYVDCTRVGKNVSARPFFCKSLSLLQK